MRFMNISVSKGGSNLERIWHSIVKGCNELVSIRTSRSSGHSASLRAVVTSIETAAKNSTNQTNQVLSCHHFIGSYSSTTKYEPGVVLYIFGNDIPNSYSEQETNYHPKPTQRTHMRYLWKLPGKADQINTHTQYESRIGVRNSLHLVYVHQPKMAGYLMKTI